MTFSEFFNTYLVNIIDTIVIALIGYIGVEIKKRYTEYVNNDVKKNVAKTCVQAVEQLYKDLHGDEKLQKCIESVTEMLAEKGITITELEIRMLIEAAVNEFNSKVKEGE